MTQDLAPNTGDVDSLIERLGSREAAVRESAELSLKTLTPDQVDQLVQIVRVEPKRTMGRMGLWFALAVWPMVFLPSWLTFGQGGGMPPIFRYLLFGGFLAGYMALFPMLVARPSLQSRLRYCVVNVNGPKLLGPLIMQCPLIMRSTIASNDGSRAGAFVSKAFLRGRLVAPEEVERALLGVLSNIRSAADVDLTGMERANLTKLLLVQRPEVVVKLLALLDMIGGSSDLVNVSALERGKCAGQSSQEVRDAAARCRATIEARIEQQKIPETLLRPSQSSSPVKELVRATTVTAPIEEQVLLRTSQPEEPLMH